MKISLISVSTPVLLLANVTDVYMFSKPAGYKKVWKGREEKGSVESVGCVYHPGKGRLWGEAAFRLLWDELTQTHKWIPAGRVRK